jgi:hypothetical protein
MASPARTHVAFADAGRGAGKGPTPRQLRIRPRAGSWHLTEDGAEGIGGIFTSMTSALDFARGELRGIQRGYIVLELGAAADDDRT